MHGLDLLVQQPAHDRREAQHVAGRHRFEAGEVLLRLEDGVEVAAIGDVEHQLAHARHVDRDLARRQIGGDIGDAHAVDEAAVLLVARHHPAGRRIEIEHARRRRRDQPVLDRHGDGADGAVAAHRQAAAHLDEQDADVAVGAGRRIEHRARHHVVAARLEHQRLADPVVVREEIEPPLAHGGALEQRRAARHQPHRIAAGMAVEAGEGMDRHGCLLTPPLTKRSTSRGLFRRTTRFSLARNSHSSVKFSRLRRWVLSAHSRIDWRLKKDCTKRFAVAGAPQLLLRRDAADRAAQQAPHHQRQRQVEPDQRVGRPPDEVAHLAVVADHDPAVVAGLALDPVAEQLDRRALPVAAPEQRVELDHAQAGLLAPAVPPACSFPTPWCR